MKQIMYLGGKKAREYDGVDEPKQPFIFDLTQYEAHISTLPVVDVIGDCDWKKGEVKTEGVDYFEHPWGINAIVTPVPTPQEWEKGKGWQDLVEKAFYYELMDMGASIRLLDFIHKTVVAPLQSELSTLRSELSAAQLQLDKNKIRIEHLTWEREEYRKNMDKKEDEIKDRKNRESDLHREIDARDKELSAAQEENKRLREALGVVMPYLDDFEKDNIQDSSVGLFKDYRFTKAYHELQSFFSPESGEQTK